MWKIVEFVKRIIVHILSYSRRVSYINNYKECIAINPELGEPAEGEKSGLINGENMTSEFRRCLIESSHDILVQTSTFFQWKFVPIL